METKKKTYGEANMKHIIKFLIALALIIVPVTASAQESGFSLDESFIGAFSLDIATGSYSDGILTLTIDEQSIGFIFLQPSFAAGLHTLTEFVSDWVVFNLETTSLLVIGDMTAEIVAVVESYDSMTGELVLSIKVNSIATIEEVKGGAEIPAQFSNAKLNFVIDQTIGESLVAGFDARISGTRPDSIPCNSTLKALGRC